MDIILCPLYILISVFNVCVDVQAATSIQTYQQLNREEQRAAVIAIKSSSLSEPILRSYINDKKRDSRDVMDSLYEVVADHQMLKHQSYSILSWYWRRRLDCLVELSNATDNYSLHSSLYDAMQGHVPIIANRAIRDLNGQFPGDRFRTKGASYAKYKQSDNFLDLSHKNALADDRKKYYYIHSRECTIRGLEEFFWTAFVGDKLHIENALNQEGVEFVNFFIVANSDLDLNQTSGSLVIVDGTLNFKCSSDLYLANNIIIARNDINIITPTNVMNGILISGRDINFKNRTSIKPDARLVAKNIIRTPIKQPDESKFVEGFDRMQDYVRFFELADVGIEAAESPSGVTITSIDPRSSFAKYGIRVGDVVKQVDRKPIPTVNEFRRLVRREYVRRAGIFDVTRNGEKLNRIVYFHGPLFEK